MLTALAAAVFCTAAGPVLAQDFARAVRADLRADGFRVVDEGRTLLGRVRILAENDRGQREIILNPRTGEILRDHWRFVGRDDDNRGRGRSGDDDDDEDDNSGKGSGDDDDDDNSGKGSGDDDDDDDNSGSGSGGGDDDDD